jgi:GH24 family phage-related lysozyme (muramidase)
LEYLKERKKTLMKNIGIRDHEGCVDTVYLDTLGKATIGIGHLVQPHERQRFKEGIKISVDEIEDLFLIDLNRACAGAEQLISENYRGDKRLPQVIEHVIVEMVFQLGKTGVSKFKKMWKALSDGDKKQASLEMQDSRWHSQTPVRCEALAEAVANA